MKKVLLINYNIYAYLHCPELKISGGAELQISILAKLLSNNGYHVFFYTGDFGQENIIQKDNYTFIKGEKNGVGKMKKFMLFAKHVLHIKPDILLERGTSPFTFLAAIIGKMFKIPFIFCAASDVNFAKRDMDPSFRGNRVKQFLYQGCLPLIKHFVVQKSSQAKLLKKNFGIDKNVSLIRNFPPEIDYLENDSDKQMTEKYDAVWIANLIPYKQPEYFIKLARLNPEFRFLLIGASSNKDYQEKIMADANSVKNLTTVGYVKHSEIIHWVRKSKIIVNTTKVASTYEEGFSNVQIMGWAVGKPSLTLISDPDGLIVSNNMGFCSRSFDQLNIDFKKLAMNNELYTQMSENALHYINQDHNSDQLFHQYMDIFTNYPRAHNKAFFETV